MVGRTTSIEFINNFLTNLPSEKDINFTIDLEPGTKPISFPPYWIVPIELWEPSIQLEDHLGKGFIHPSDLPWGALILFIKKKDGILQICINYR